MVKGKINRQYKDRLFKLLFENNKEQLLQLYNALRGSNYTDIDALEINTLEDVQFGNLLGSHRAEVREMCLTEFNEQVYEDGIREEGRQEGREEGREEALKSIVTYLMSTSDSLDAIYAKVTSMDIYSKVTREQIERLLEE